MLRFLLASLLPLLVSAPAVRAQDAVLSADFRDGAKGWKAGKAGKAKAAAFSSDGLEIRDGGGVEAPASGRDLANRFRRASAITLEARFAPADLGQKGPARIFTFSRNPSERNFTIGQEGDRIEVRLRTTKSGKNGTPGLQSKPKSLRKAPTHVVFTWRKGGEAVLYLDGKVAAKKRIDGDLTNWDPGHAILVGDEAGGGRAWRGRIESVALYEGAFTPGEVEDAYRAGNPLGLSRREPEPEPDPNVELFETQVASLLARRCLECHDSASAKGDLDLSRALASHREEGVLVPGKAVDSLLWESIENDDMPHERPSLTMEEKSLLRSWIDGGAAWTVDFLDPAIYAQPPAAPSPRARRLTVDEYVATVRDVFGVDLEEEAREWLPPDLRADGFRNTAYNLNVDLGHVEAWGRLARAVVEELDVAAFAKRFSPKRDLTDKTMIALIGTMGETVLRGPLDGDESALYRGVSTTVASAGGDFDAAVGYVLEAMLQSPRFLYRIEEPARGDRPRRADDWELASRLSYTIWGSAPDAELIRLAREGRLDSEEVIRRQAERMLGDRRAVDRSLAFVAEWLHLERLSHMQPSREHFPEWDPALAADMRKETLAFAEEVIWKERRPLADLLDASYTFVTPDLARHYGIPHPDGEGLARVDLSEVPARGGILTQGSVLTVGGDEASMVSRGLFVLNDLLRGVIQDPPPDIDTSPKPSGAGLSRRGVAMERVADKTCGGCHVRFEPLAYGLEKFDGLGAFHERDEHGNALREDGEVLFPGAAEPEPYETIGELMSLLARSDRVRETLTWKVAQYAMGRPLAARDARVVAGIHERATEAGGRYEDVVVALVLSDLVRQVEPGRGDSPTN